MSFFDSKHYFFVSAILIYSIAIIAAKPAHVLHLSQVSYPLVGGQSSGYVVYPNNQQVATGYAHGYGGQLYSSGYSAQPAGYSTGYGQYYSGYPVGQTGTLIGSTSNIGEQSIIAPSHPKINSHVKTNLDGHFDSTQIFHLIRKIAKKCPKGKILVKGKCQKEKEEEDEDEEEEVEEDEEKETNNKRENVNIYFVCPNGFQYADGNCKPTYDKPVYEYPSQQQYSSQNQIYAYPSATQNCGYAQPCTGF